MLGCSTDDGIYTSVLERPGEEEHIRCLSVRKVTFPARTANVDYDTRCVRAT